MYIHIVNYYNIKISQISSKIILILEIWKCNVKPKNDHKGMHTAPYTPRQPLKIVCE